MEVVNLYYDCPLGTLHPLSLEILSSRSRISLYVTMYDVQIICRHFL